MEIRRRDVEDGLAAGLSLAVQAVDRARVGDQHAGGKLGVRVERQLVLDDVLVLAVQARRAGAEHDAAVRDARMVAVKLLLADKVHGRVVVREIVRHRDDRLFDGGKVRALLRDDKALARVLLARRKLRVFTGADALERALDRDRVLARVLHAGDAADRVGVALAHALAPERVVAAVRQDGLAVKAVQREHARIPADRDHTELAALFARRVDGVKVLRDLRVRVEAVDHVEILRELRGLLRQVVRAAAAEDHDVDLVRHARGVRHRVDRRAGLCLQRFGAAARENADELHILCTGQRAFHAAAEISVSCNADSNHF